MTSSQSDSSMLKDILSRRIPALLTRMSRLPKVSMACSTTFLPPSHELMSSPLTAASPPLSLIRATTSSAGCSSCGLAGQRPDVVDDDLGALAGQQERLLAPDASAGSGDDGHFAVEQSHGVSSLCRSACCAGRPKVFSVRAGVEWRGAQQHCRWAHSGAKPGQGVVGDLGDQRGVSRRARATPKRAARLMISIPRAGSEHRRVGAADDAEHRAAPARRTSAERHRGPCPQRTGDPGDLRR